MSLTSCTADFGGQKRVFDLRIGEVEELEKLCGAGIGEIFLRMSSMRFSLADARQSIRLGLIGGGMAPPEAAFLLGRYVDGRPMQEWVQTGVDVVRAFMVGTAAAVADNPSGEAKGSERPATSSPLSQPES